MANLFLHFHNYYLFIFFQIIGAPFLEEAKNKEEDKESPNPCMVVEASLDEIPLTSNFDSQMPQAEDVETPNSHAVVAINLNEILSTLNVDFEVLVHLQQK